jgi:GxxExxY protein
MAGTLKSLPEYTHESLTRQVIRAFYDVYNELGVGFVESVYESALHISLADRRVNVSRQAPVAVWYKGHQVGRFRADLVVEGTVILELKAVRKLEPSHEAQLLNLLRSTQLEVGLLLNFGPRPQVKRLVFSNARKASVGCVSMR